MRSTAVAAFVAAAVAVGLGGAPAARAVAPYHLLFSADRDGDLDIYAASVDGRGAVAVTHNSVNDVDPVLSPDGRSFAVRRGRKVVVVGPGVRERVVGAGEPEAWSPDGRTLAIGGATFWLSLVDVATGSVRRFGRSTGVYSAAWSPGADQISYEDANLSAFVLDLRSGRRFAVGVPDYVAPVWSPLGGEFAYSGEGDRFDPELVVRTVRRRLLAIAGDAPAWSPNGKSLAYVRPNPPLSHPGLYVLDLRTRRSRQLAAGPVGPPAWSPAGDRIAYTRRGVVEVVQVGGGRPHVLAGSTGALESGPRWSPDGRLLAFPVRGHRIVVADTRGGPAHVVGRGRRISIIGWSPGGVRGPTAPLLGLPPLEEARGNTLLVRGVVTEIAADGRRVALLVVHSRVCMHASAWRVGTARPTDVRNPGPCGDYQHSEFHALTLHGAAVTWRNFYCNMQCYEGTISAVAGGTRGVRSGSDRYVNDSAYTSYPKHLAPGQETVAGISVRLAGGILHVSAHGGSRIVRASAPIIDFDATPAGLFYAYDMPSGTARGRVVFLPLASLR
jgi:hypothetical protein